MSLRSDLRAVYRVWPLLGVSWPRLAVAAGWGSLALGCAVGLAATSAWLIARASQMPSVLDLTVAVVAVRALGIGRGLFRYLDRLAGHDVALRGAQVLRTRLYQALSVGRPEALAWLRRGEVLRRWGADVDDVGDLVVRAVLPAIVAAVVGVGSVVLVAALSPAVGVIMAVSLAVAGVITPIASAASARRSEIEGAQARGEVSAAALMVLDGAAELSVGGRLPRAMDGLRQAEANVPRTRDRAAAPAAVAQAVTLVCMGAAVLGALLIGSIQLDAGTLAAVELSVIVLTPLAAFEAVTLLAPAAVHAVRAADAARRLRDLLDRAEQHRTGSRRAEGRPVIEAVDLAVGWPDRAPALTGVNLTVEVGQTLVIIGPNGSGKSTLLTTLAGLLPPVSGSVTLAGVPTADLADGESCRVAVLTAEDAHLFDTTVMENLRVARGDVDAEQARAALVRAGLGPSLEGWPDGLDEPVGPGGARLSGGERRRLLVARGLLSQAPLLLLDEPDEHLDADTATALMSDLCELASDRGIVIVTHRRYDVLADAQVLDLTDSSAGSA